MDRSTNFANSTSRGLYPRGTTGPHESLNPADAAGSTRHQPTPAAQMYQPDSATSPRTTRRGQTPRIESASAKRWHANGPVSQTPLRRRRLITLVPRQQGGQIGYTHCSPKRRPGRRAGQRGIGSRVQNPARMGPLECHPGKARPGARSVNRPHLAPAGHRGRLRTSPVARDGISGPLWVVVL